MHGRIDTRYKLRITSYAHTHILIIRSTIIILREAKEKKKENITGEIDKHAHHLKRIIQSLDETNTTAYAKPDRIRLSYECSSRTWKTLEFLTTMSYM